MAKLAAIIPSRSERFLTPTIHDLMRNARGEFEIVVTLDGYWPDDWNALTSQYPNLHTVHFGEARGMRAAINAAVASAISRRAKFIIKTDAHCSFSEGFDVTLQSECEPNWVVIPRRGRLDPEQWTATDTHKLDIDYHYLSFPDDPNDFGGPGLNGKVWVERALQRKDILLDEEMSSQGSAYFLHAKYFTELELMDEEHYGMFWNEMQEIGLKCWLSGGQVMVNKKAKYLHLHKGRKYGRGYKLPESELTKGATFTKKWLFNEAWPKQTLPFKSLIERFWPVPTWPEDWEERVYSKRDAVKIPVTIVGIDPRGQRFGNVPNMEFSGPVSQLQILSARYGVDFNDPDKFLDVTNIVRSLVKGNSLDIVVSNEVLAPGRNPFRGRKKTLWLDYTFNTGEGVQIQRQEKEWLIIGPAATANAIKEVEQFIESTKAKVAELRHLSSDSGQRVVDKVVPLGPMTAPALNDYLIRKFNISDRRLRAPMPVELRDFNRNDLAKLFAELGFTRGAEIGVAEGKYSEVLLQANPECQLHLIDPWHRYSENPQNKTKEKHEFALNEVYRRVAGYPNVLIYQENSMDALHEVPDIPLDFVYIDANHSFDFVMQDLIEWSKRVRSGGIVSGDDYYELDRKRWGAGPVEAVQAYTKAHEIKLWFLISAPNSVDYFWVKP